MKRMIWVLAVVAMVSSVALGEEMVENPQYKQWAAFKPGTMTKLAMKSEMAMEGQSMTTTMTMTMTLKEVTAEKAVVEMTAEVNAQGQTMKMPPQTQTIPAKIEKSKVDMPPGAPKDVKVTKKGEGDEQITVGGKTYNAHWVEMEMSGDTVAGVTKVWTTPEVPGGLVKNVTNATKPMPSKMTMELVEFNAVK